MGLVKNEINMSRIQLHKSIQHVTTANGKLSDKTIKLINIMAKKKRMEVNDIMQHIDELLQNYSNEECAEILKEVVSECQSRIENCDEGVYTNS